MITRIDFSDNLDNVVMLNDLINTLQSLLTSHGAKAQIIVQPHDEYDGLYCLTIYSNRDKK